MTTDRLLDAVTPWLERRLGAPLSALGRDPTPVLAVSPDAGGDSVPLRALRLGEGGVVVARPEWVDPLRERVSDLALDQLFTVFGAYEMARVTLPDGIAVWGPNWNIFADAESLRPAEGPRPRRLDADDFARVDFGVFWHCESAHPAAGFGVYEEDRLLALATATDEGDPVMEIGVDVAPGAQGRGLGRAVVSAAGRWIVAQGKIAMATVAPWNVPSTRNLRSVGLRHLYTDLIGVEGPFRVGPQPLGTPLPGMEVHDWYPRWAMNKDIRPR